MKTAFSVWENRIAPVFDVARQLHIVQSEAGKVVSEIEESVVHDGPTQKALHLVELGVNTLVCGAISRQLLKAMTAYGIRVVPFIAGELRPVIEAQLNGKIQSEEYAMPGTLGRRQQGKSRRGSSLPPSAGRRKDTS